jgi:plastocyanin
LTRLRAAALGLLAFSLLLPALPAGAADHVKTQTVRVDAVEYSFTLTPKTVRRGTVTFVVVNLGQRSHDFKIAGRRTPMIAPGATAKLSVTFAKPGSYAYYCTVAGHAVAGMKGVLKVT